MSVIRRPSINGEIKISKGKCVEKLPHSCGSRRGLQVFQKEGGTYDGFCFSCGTAVADPYKDKPEGYKPAYNPKTDEEIQEELDEVKEFQTVALKDRGLSKESLEHFGIKIGLSEVDGVTPTSHFYPYYKGDELKGFKCRVIEGKKFFSIGSVKDVDLFGWHQAVLSGGKKLFVTEGECFTPEAQVLTPKGWVSFKDLGTEEVLQVNEDGSSTFVDPIAYVDKHYEGKLVEYQSGSYYSLTTPEHNVVRIKDGKFTKVKATRSIYLPIPRTVSSVTNNISQIDENVARLQAMFSADFSFRKEGDLYGSFKKQRKIERARDLLAKSGVRYTETNVSRGMVSFFVHRGHNLPVSKLFNTEWLFSNQRETLLEEILYWDGNSVTNREQIEYSTKEVHNAEFVQTLAHLCGYTSTIIKRTRDKYTWYKVSILYKKQTSSTQNGFKEVDYSGRVMCVTVPSGMILVRQNGSISISGNCDAVALYQIFRAVNKGTKYESNIPAIVSLAHGSGSAVKELLKHREMIFMHFKEIVLVFDQDKPGEEAVEAVLKVFPEGVSVAHLPRKDANQCLLEGVSKAAYNAVAFNSVKPKNTRLVLADSLFEEAKIAPTIGAPWPWEAVTKKTRGIRLGETIYIGAAQKMGKSEIVNTLAAHFIKELGWPVLLAKPEESNKKSVKLVAGKIVGKIFHDPNVPFDEASYDEACDLMRNKLFLINLYQHLGWETLKADIRAAAMEGCKAIFIDPITNLTNGMSAADANTRLQEIAQELSAMALDLNVVIFIFCHLRNPDSGPPHERGGEVLSSQFAGSRAMARSCNLMFGLEGNRDPHLNPEERNVRTLVLLEDREFGEVGRFKLYWDRATSLFNEIGEE